MLHIFKLNGHRAAYDCAKREYYPLSALAMKIIEGVTPPLSPECPSSLRYSLAKYDSGDLSAAYREVYALYESGLLFGEEKAAATEPDTRYAVIDTTGGAAQTKIDLAIAQGYTHMLVTLRDASPCLASTIRQNYAGKLTLHLSLILDAPISDEDIAVLNDAQCYGKLPASDNWLTEVLSLADRGLCRVDATLPSNANVEKELGKLAKEIERRKGESTTFSFAPFDLALLATESYNAAHPACADCWAREICGGQCLSDDKASPLCAVKRTAIECAITLSAENA